MSLEDEIKKAVGEVLDIARRHDEALTKERDYWRNECLQLRELLNEAMGDCDITDES